MSNREYTASQKLAMVQGIESGRIGVEATVKEYGVSKSTLAAWRRRYKAYGYEGLEVRTHNNNYTAELKHQAVKKHLYGGLSQSQVIEKYKIASRTQLRNWIKKYNGHNSLNAYTGEKTAMTKGRSTTWQERIEIALYCLAHERDYGKAAAQFKVSYQQIYGWVKKYEEGGTEALQDGRGRTKAPVELTD